MIQTLLVTICLVVFSYQGSSIILESRNVNEYEVVYPQKVPALPKGGLQKAEPKTEYKDTMQYEFKVNGEPVVLHLKRNKDVPFYHFSNCSIQEYRAYLIRVQPQCILNKPLRTDIVAPAVCGNYFVEVGEECDCGPPQDCQSACCNATTCQLQPEAQCDSEECCEQCRFKVAGTECRAIKDDCDLADNCTGQSADCPTDLFQRDGHPCQNNEGYCYNGKCPTLANQCLAFWGTNYNVGLKGCFQKNQIGNDFGYCRRENGVNIPCEPQDIKCGRLFCTRKNTKFCKWKYLPNDPDDGMVEPGTKCADRKVCRNRQCVDV